MESQIKKFLDDISQTQSKRQKANKANEMFCFLANHAEWVYQRPKLWKAVQFKLVDLTAFQGFDGCLFFDTFEIDVNYLIDFIREERENALTDQSF